MHSVLCVCVLKRRFPRHPQDFRGSKNLATSILISSTKRTGPWARRRQSGWKERRRAVEGTQWPPSKAACTQLHTGQYAVGWLQGTDARPRMHYQVQCLFCASTQWACTGLHLRYSKRHAESLSFQAGCFLQKWGVCLVLLPPMRRGRTSASCVFTRELQAGHSLPWPLGLFRA